MEDISTPVEENLDDPFDLDIQLYPVSSSDVETLMTLPDGEWSLILCTVIPASAIC